MKPRREVSRASHGEWRPSPARPDPVALLRAQAASRDQTLVPIRSGRMLSSPFTFYRGAAAVMAADLAGSPCHVRRDRAGLRRCPYLELRRFCRPRPPPAVRPQRLRRDATGTVGMGRQTDGGEHRDRRARHRASGPDAASDRQAISLASIAWDVASSRARRARHVVCAARCRRDHYTIRRGVRSRRRAEFVHTFTQGRHKTSARAVQRFTELVTADRGSSAHRRCLHRFASSHVWARNRAVRPLHCSTSTSTVFTRNGRIWSTPTRSWTLLARSWVSAASARAPGWRCWWPVPAGRHRAAVQGSPTIGARPTSGSQRVRWRGERVVRGQRMMQAAPTCS